MYEILILDKMISLEDLQKANPWLNIWPGEKAVATVFAFPGAFGNIFWWTVYEKGLETGKTYVGIGRNGPLGLFTYTEEEDRAIPVLKECKLFSMPERGVEYHLFPIRYY